MQSYNYASNVRPPKALGMSPDGTLSALGNDINGLISYTQLLVCLLYTSPSPRDRTRSRMPSSA